MSTNDALAFAPHASALPMSVQRKCDACVEDERKVQRESIGSSEAVTTAPPIVDDALRTSGEPLDEGARRFMEPRLGCVFDDVRVHTGAVASRAARAVSARAFTVGSHIVFQDGEYAPSTHAGRRLLAHELTHVVQQSNVTQPTAAAVSQGISHPDDASERDADALADSLLSGAGGSIASPMRAVQAAPATFALQRQVASADPAKMGRCRDLLELIKEAVAVLLQRAHDLITDPLGLQWDNWYVPKIMPDGTNVGSVAGHQQQYEGWRNRLRNLIEEWDEDDCNETGLRVPREIRDLVFQPTPAPTPRPRPAPESPRPWTAPGDAPSPSGSTSHRIGSAAGGAAIGAAVGGVIGALAGGVGGTAVAPGVGTVGGAVVGWEAGLVIGASVGGALGAAAGWLLGG